MPPLSSSKGDGYVIHDCSGLENHQQRRPRWPV
ncbi:unnamed protein product [Larinioides sclopetarius]|uniref:Uncharacterized protein n=1 Tax=Larinioides sclopetarius TaxID=280406 RepID=A0AAV2A0N9_9ARAC